MIGGSSDQFGLTTPAQRPDGSNTIFGGDGSQIGRDNYGDLSPGGHARDADVIMGNNGDIFRPVGANGQFLNFNYDTSGYEGYANPNMAAGTYLQIIPRAVNHLDYTAGMASPTDIGGSDTAHGEAGDDTIFGGPRDDVLYGDGQNDDIYGGAGNNWVSGGTGDDGIIGTDGLLETSQNGLTEPLNGIFTASTDQVLSPDPATSTEVNVTGTLSKTAIVAAPTLGGDNILYGGLGNDSVHGGGGDDAISGAEAPIYGLIYLTYVNNTPAGQPYRTVESDYYHPVNLGAANLGYNYDGTRRFVAYDYNNPWAKIPNFFLNFDPYVVDEATGQPLLNNGAPLKQNDGDDVLFGDNGNDWLVGGTGCNTMFGGLGDDLINGDNNLDTDGGKNDMPDPAPFNDGDLMFGGGGLDVMIANTGKDRMYDWTGEFNSYIVPFSAFGQPTVNRDISPKIVHFLTQVGAADGTDPTETEPNGELGLVTQKDALWSAQHGAPRDPQPGNIGGVQRDATSPSLSCTDNAQIFVQKFVTDTATSLPPVHSTSAPGPYFHIGNPLVWTYTVQNFGLAPLTVKSLVDDAGTPSNPADAFMPAPVFVTVNGVKYNVGDSNDNGLLDPGETWTFTSAGVVTASVISGLYKNTVIATGTSTADGTTSTATDVSFYTGVVAVPGIEIKKAIDAVDPLHPTTAEEADTAPGPFIQAGTTVTWTYRVINTGNVALQVGPIVDDAGTPANTADDFTPKYVSGDTNHDGLLEPGEVWLYTSSGVANANTTAIVGPYENTASVTGTIPNTSQTVTSSDVANYFGFVATAAIKLVKAINAADPSHPTAAEDANTGTGPILTAGQTGAIVWTYLVTNTGSVPLSSISLVDDNGTPDSVPGASADDFVPKFVSGDTNNNGVLDPGETWLYTSLGVVNPTVIVGQYVNIATVTAVPANGMPDVSASDPARYFGQVVTVSPNFTVVKAVNAIDPTAPTPAEDANSAPGPYLVPGTPLVWTYLLTNTGNTQLSITSVVDDNGTPTNPADDFKPKYVQGDTNNNGLLDPGETWLYTSTGVVSSQVVAGQYVNWVTATAVPANSPPGTTPLVRRDPAYYFGSSTLAPSIKIVKAINAADPNHPTAADDANSAPGKLLLDGTPITWTYQVTNTGAGPLDIISLMDNAGTPNNTADDFIPVSVPTSATNSNNIGDLNNNGLLDPGETWLFTSQGAASPTQAVATEGPYVNTATVVALVATGSNTGQAVTSRDSAYDYGYAINEVGLLVRKAINAVNPMMPTAAELAQAAPGQPLPVGTPVVWTYQVLNTGTTPIKLTSVRDDAGTPSNPLDDFTATGVLQPGTVWNVGDTNRNGLLDPGEEFLFTSAGVSAGSPTDWITVTQDVLNYTDTTGAGSTPGFVHDPVNSSATDNIFTIGQTKDTNGIGSWNWTFFKPQNKDDIADAFGATLTDAGTGHTLLSTGLDRYASNGDSTVGFWFFQQPVSANANGTFSGRHTDGDLLLVVDFSVGGSSPAVAAYRWTGTDASGTITLLSPPAGSTFALVPSGPVSVPWPFIDKFGFTSPQTGEFLEAGVDLTALFGANVPRYESFLSETRSSTSTTATLSDFALGIVNTIGTHYIVQLGQYKNTVTVTGLSQATGATVVAKDSNYHFGTAKGPELAAALRTGPQVGVSLLTQAQLTPIVAEAEARWAALTNLPLQLLKDVPVVIADLPDGGNGELPVLGYTTDVVQIDVNAGGFGWFIDPTPANDLEFSHAGSLGALSAAATSPASGRMDLLTVVMHELGHVLGLGDVTTAGHPNDLMDDTLLPGVRRLPSVADVTLEPGKQHRIDAAEILPADRSAAVATDLIVTPVGDSGAPFAATPVVVAAQTSMRTVPIDRANGFSTTHVTASVAADHWVTAVAAPLSGAGTSGPPAPVLRVDRRLHSRTVRLAPSAILAPTRYSARRVGGASVSRHTDAMAVSDAQPHQPIESAGLFDQALEAFASDPARLQVVRDWTERRGDARPRRFALDSPQSIPLQGLTTDHNIVTVGAVTPRKLKMRGFGALRP
jgi:hypothetical protein